MINAISILRIFCCIQVFLIHYFAYLDLRNHTWIFSAAVPCFILMSAYLCGLKYDTNRIGKSFLIKRYKSLSSYYYPFLVGVFIFYSLINPDYFFQYLPTAILNLFYVTTLSKPLPHCGHLWFMQTIAICYIAIYLLNRDFFRRMFTNRISILILFFLCCLFGFLYRGAITWYLYFYLLLFFNAKRIHTFISSPQFNKRYIILTISIIMCYWLLSIDYTKLFHTGIYFRYMHSCILAILILILFLRIFKDMKNYSFITYSASITMEVYLVHHLFVFDYPLYVSLPVTIILSVILHKIGTLILTHIPIIINK